MAARATDEIDVALGMLHGWSEAAEIIGCCELN